MRTFRPVRDYYNSGRFLREVTGESHTRDELAMVTLSNGAPGPHSRARSETGKSILPVSTAFPQEMRFSAAPPRPQGVSAGLFPLPYATLRAHMPMELPNFDIGHVKDPNTSSDDPADGWRPVPVAVHWSGPSLPEDAETGEASSFPLEAGHGPSPKILDSGIYPTELFTHIPGRVVQADTDPSMLHAAPTLAALAHQDTRGLVPMNPDWDSSDGLTIDNEYLDTLSSAASKRRGSLHRLRRHSLLNVTAKQFSDEELDSAEERALENAFPTSLNATSRRKSFEQGKLF